MLRQQGGKQFQISLWCYLLRMCNSLDHHICYNLNLVTTISQLCFLQGQVLLDFVLQVSVYIFA